MSFHSIKNAMAQLFYWENFQHCDLLKFIFIALGQDNNVLYLVYC